MGSEVKLGEIANFTTGKLNSNASEEKGIFPFFTCSPTTSRINTFAFDQKAILLAGNNAEGNFNLKYFEGKFNAYQRTYVIDIKDQNVSDLKYLYFALSLCLQRFKQISQGTSTKFLTAKILNEFEIKLPSISEQRSISATLSSLDDKIELNNRIIANIEAQTQAIFKSWFVDFEPFQDGEFEESELGLFPKGWRIDKIGSMPVLVTDFVANGSFSTLKENVTIHHEPNYAYFIRNTDLKSQHFDKYVDKKAYDFLSKSSLVGGEVIISNVGDVGSVFLCPELDKPMTLGNNVILVNTIQSEDNVHIMV